jgi:hypothetical protein
MTKLVPFRPLSLLKTWFGLNSLANLDDLAWFRVEGWDLAPTYATAATLVLEERVGPFHQRFAGFV